ncbi:MAG: aspartate kinase [Planctomycetota bacterium]|nr:MAG: aspartate kinase [Planctomycetota bacterium]
MPIVVQKFGGTSLANAEKFHRAARRAIQAKLAGNQVAVVVSAMDQTTDELISLAYEVTDRPSRREMDQLLATGEQVSIALMAMAIHHAGHDAISMTGAQIGIKTDRSHGRARIREITGRTQLMSLLNQGSIVIVAGFQGVDEQFNVTTLGRGGSDTTAVALAASLQADVCEIYTDVDGIYSADPRIVPAARKLDYIFYDEMLELASLGAQVMHSRSIELGKNYGVRLCVRSCLTDAKGTDIVNVSSDLQQVIVRGAALKKGLARVELVRVPNRPGIASEIFRRVAEREVMVDDIIQVIHAGGTTADLSFTVDKGDVEACRNLGLELGQELPGLSVEIRDKLAKVSVVGVGMRTHTGVASRMFEALHQSNVNIENISTSEIVISCVIREEDGERALRAVHEVFELDHAASGGQPGANPLHKP